MITAYAASTPLCNCPVERSHEAHGARASAPRCVLPEWHAGDPEARRRRRDDAITDWRCARVLGNV